MTAHEIIYTALVWGEESLTQMIVGCSPKDPYRAECEGKLRQLQAYRKRRFGKEKNLLEGSKLVDVFDTYMKQKDS